MGAKVLVLAFDSMDARLIERWCDEGYLPHLSGLRAESAAFRLANTLDSLPGAIWVELSTGRSVGRDGRFYAPDQLRTGEAELRKIAADEVETAHDVWNVAGAAGRRVLAFDIPERRPRAGVNGIHVSDWGGHDMQWPCAAEPTELVDELRSRFASHPVPACNVVHGTGPERYAQLARDLVAGVELRTDLLLSLLAREPWDLAVLGFIEVHCVGHQFWLFTDVGAPHRHPVTVENPPADLRTAMRDVYIATDAAVGRLLAEQGPDTYVCALASHGYGPFTEGGQLLPEVLARLGLRRKHEVPAASLPSKLPTPVRDRLRRVVPKPLRWRRMVLAGRTPSRELVMRSTRAVSLPNNRCGAIRLNLRGREPFGSVAPGTEARELVEEIRTALHELRDPASGEPIVVHTMTPTELFGPDHHPDLPDVMVLFRDDLGPIEACTSPRVGGEPEAHR
jgi:predicted AlkP superfamily phosphohydrolase/phosphomutase